MGYKTKFGNSFAKNSLNTILKNEKYIGTFIYNKKQEKGVDRKRNPKLKPREEWIVVENGIPAIIDHETFEKVQNKMKKNLNNGGKFKAKEIYLLSGLIYCGECGSSMYGNSRMCGRNKSKYVSYRCSDRANHKGCKNKELRKEYLENYVLDELYNNLFSESSIKKLSSLLADYNRKQSEINGTELITIDREFKDIEIKINSLLKLVMAGISIDTVKNELKQLEDKKALLESYRQELSLKNTDNVFTEEVIIDLINKSKDFVKTKNIAECSNFIQSYVDKVIVYSNRVEVLFKIGIPSQSTDSIEQLKTEETIKTLQNEYGEAVKA